MTVNIEDLLTVAAVAEELHVSTPTARTMLSSVEPAFKVGNAKLYSRESVQAHLRVTHASVLGFLGVRPQGESYDTNITAAEAVAEESE